MKIVVFLFLFLAAGTALAQGVVPCDGVTEACDTAAFFELVNKVLDYFVFTLAVPVATVAIAWAGIMMATHPAQETKRTEAKEILKAAVIGLVLVLAAWLIVNSIFDYLVEPELKGDVKTFLPQR